MIKKNARKDSFIQIRVNAKEQLEIEKAATSHGYVNLSAFVLWLVEKYGNKNQKK